MFSIAPARSPQFSMPTIETGLRSVSRIARKHRKTPRSFVVLAAAGLLAVAVLVPVRHLSSKTAPRINHRARKAVISAHL